MTKAITLAAPETQAVIDLALREALVNPYLMDELLALSAAHKSTLTTTGQLGTAAAAKSYYRTEAMRLQT